ncbi:hypothetical protein NDU88_010745 [Pleurodeles waltl]|uniref:Uncharacterized protein n=1 Tax=Pleurodeles waltl TaxID=8319 RepID=A0AAV7QYR6_PLEWA|nr:hypothetical protein NDU88_010745 [Pleurodeles waltl]
MAAATHPATESPEGPWLNLRNCAVDCGLRTYTDSYEEEIDEHRRELLVLMDDNEELRYLLEDLENLLCQANIKIKEAA